MGDGTQVDSGKGGQFAAAPFLASGLDALHRTGLGSDEQASSSLLHIPAQGKRRNRAEAAAVRQALAEGQEVAFASRHERYRYRRRKPQ